MAAISKSWVTIADAAVDPDSPGDATLMTGIRDNLVHLREWLGASFTGGAVQDHNHDGANSALVQVGANLIRNGSFEDGEAGWTITDYTGGSHSVQATVRHHGEKALSFTSTSTANGGGDALSNEFLPVTEGHTYRVDYQISASAANISSRSQVIWYDAAKAQISAVNIYDETNTPTARTHYSSPIVAPTNARFAKLKLIGGVPGAGSATGTIYFDAVFFVDPPTGFALLKSGEASSVANVDLDLRPYAGYSQLRVVVEKMVPATDNTGPWMRVSNDGGATFKAGASDYQYALAIGAASGGGFVNATAAAQVPLANTGLDNAATSGGLNGHIDILLRKDGAAPTFVQTTMSYYNNDGSVVHGQMGTCSRHGNEADNALRFLFSTGNIAQMKWKLQGWL